MNALPNGQQPTAPAAARPAVRSKASGGTLLGQDSSREARRLALVILEVLAGGRTPVQAATALAISLPRYYHLESRALRGLLSGCEARPRGRVPNSDSELAALRRRNERLQQEVDRQQSLVRMAQRSMGIAPPPPPVKNGANVRAAHEVEHMKQLQQLVQQGSSQAPQPRRGPAGQQAERALEQATRRRAVELYEQAAVEQGWTQGETATRLGILPRTLRDWWTSYRRQELGAVPLGRPLMQSSCCQRNAVIDVLQEQGPATSLAALQDRFPVCARAELDDLLHRYRDCYRQQHRRLLHVLHWQVPGTVWAADFAEAPRLIDGLYPYLLAVRDLASGYQLLWQPVAAMTVEVVLAMLARLFSRHGAPLVLKMDNGSSFRAEVTKDFLEAAEVIPLFSPPGVPSYNGSIEAAIGSLKTRTEAQAAWQGRPGQWRWEDVAAALADANRAARSSDPAVEQVWAARQPLTEVTRVSFGLAVEGQRLQARQEAGVGLEEESDHWRGSAVDRRAIGRALGEHGYLVFRRRRILLPVRGSKMTKVR